MKLTHTDEGGKASMVDVTDKSVTSRTAVAVGKVWMHADTLQLIIDNGHKKGDVLAVARIAGIQAAKQTAGLIPLCHPLALTSIKVNFDINMDNQCIDIEAVCKLADKTGVEMEALTAVSVAALTIYDMCKAVDKNMVIEGVKVIEKTGGKSGDWCAQR